MMSMSLSPHHLRRPILATVATFVALFSLAAHTYPGGTHFNRHSIGHDFWRNTLCDVARSRALDGASNRAGAMLAQCAMTVLAIGLGMLFYILPYWFAQDERGTRLAKAVRSMGIFFVPFAIAVVFLPTDRFSALHGLAIVLAGVPGFSAAILALTGLLRSDSHAPTIVKRLGLLAISISAIDFSIYVDEVIRGGSARLSVVVLERVATLLLLLWMVVVARRLQSAKRDSKIREPATK
jgi:hypothetical protein